MRIWILSSLPRVAEAWWRVQADRKHVRQCLVDRRRNNRSRVVVEDGVSPTNSCTAPAKRVPREANTRGEVVLVGVDQTPRHAGIPWKHQSRRSGREFG